VNRLAVLARLAKLRVDEARIALARAEDERDRMVAAIAELEAALAVERVAATCSLEARSTFAAYAEAARRRRDGLRGGVERAAAAVAAGLDVLQARFRELKTYDLAIEAEEARAEERARRVETAEMDEVAADRARRRTGRGAGRLV
jgi:flagellar export protein FliJ